MYQWMLALHVVAIISWMAGVLYHFRVLIYLVERGGENTHTRQVLLTMAQRLYRFIVMPAMGVAYIAGFTLIAWRPELMRGAGWLHAKLALVLLLTLWSVFGGRLMKRFARELPGAEYGRKLRFYNEVPTVIMILIAILVFVRPF